MVALTVENPIRSRFFSAAPFRFEELLNKTYNISQRIRPQESNTRVQSGHKRSLLMFPAYIAHALLYLGHRS